MRVSDAKLGVILAGGKSRRMGQDKAALSIGGTSLLSHVQRRLAPQCQRLVLSAPHDWGERLPFIPDLKDSPGGPASALYSVWRALQTTSLLGFYTVPVDGPNLPLDLCAKLSSETTAIAATVTQGHPTFGYWRMQDLKTAFTAQGRDTAALSLFHLAELCHARRIIFEHSAAFINLNTPQDLDVWKQSRDCTLG